MKTSWKISVGGVIAGLTLLAKVLDLLREQGVFRKTEDPVQGPPPKPEEPRPSGQRLH